MTELRATGPRASATAMGGSAGVPVALTTNREDSRGDIRLTYREALDPPCLSCHASPCCTYLLLADFHLQTLIDVDHAMYLLNFEGIYLEVHRDRKVNVYLYQSCGFLDVPTGLCTVHNTPIQPAVCVQYNGHVCGYRHRMTADVDPDRPHLDPRRMRWLAERTIFDDDRQVAALPEWEEMLEAFRSMPLVRTLAPAPAPDPVMEEWRSIVLSQKGSDGASRPLRRYADPEVSDPCTGCEAWCCQTLVFNRGVPGDASQLEFLRYCLGFPGVEVGVSADSWAVIVRTSCRHLDGNRCSVYGTDERPLKCSHYDALSCGYRGHFGVPRPTDIVRISRDQFRLVADSIIFDDLGRIVAIPPVDVLRDRLEQAERAAAGVSLLPSLVPAGGSTEAQGASAPQRF
jgi:hypothetical protein